jgi:hypothetical protein
MRKFSILIVVVFISCFKFKNKSKEIENEYYLDEDFNQYFKFNNIYKSEEKKFKFFEVKVEYGNGGFKNDTVFELNYNKSRLMYYLSYGKLQIIDSYIKDEIFIIGNGIRVGIDKKNFSKKIPELKNKLSDSFFINDIADLMSIYFRFENDILVEIAIFNSAGYIHDN